MRLFASVFFAFALAGCAAGNSASPDGAVDAAATADSAQDQGLERYLWPDGAPILDSAPILDTTPAADSKPVVDVGPKEASGPDLCGACGPGMKCGPTGCVCDPVNCTGCCDAATDTCQPGTTNALCGASGATCAPCAATSCTIANCSTGTCVTFANPAGAYPCPGSYGTVCGGSTGVTCLAGLSCATFVSGQQGFCTRTCTKDSNCTAGAPPNVDEGCNLLAGSQKLCGFYCSPGSCPTGLSCDYSESLCK